VNFATVRASSSVMRLDSFLQRSSLQIRCPGYRVRLPSLPRWRLRHIDPRLVGGRARKLPLDVVSGDGVRLGPLPLRPPCSARDPSPLHEHLHCTMADRNTVPEAERGIHPP
jgi:hypothetical protein